MPKEIKDLTDNWFNELKEADIGETDWLDFKRGDTEKICSCVTSFLNKETGGIILCGLEKQEKNFIFEDIPNHQKLLDDKISKRWKDITDPPINEIICDVVDYQNKKIIAIIVKPGDKFPYFFKGVIYLRHGSNSFPITDKRAIMNLIGQEITLNKALRILKNELKLIKEDTMLIRNSIENILRTGSFNGIFGVLSQLPKTIDDSRLRSIFLNLEQFLVQKNILDKYYEILKKISYINMYHHLLTSSLVQESYGNGKRFCNFGTLPNDLLSLISDFEKSID